MTIIIAIDKSRRFSVEAEYSKNWILVDSLILTNSCLTLSDLSRLKDVWYTAYILTLILDELQFDPIFFVLLYLGPFPSAY